jgi:hypothetical protein
MPEKKTMFKVKENVKKGVPVTKKATKKLSQGKWVQTNWGIGKNEVPPKKYPTAIASESQRSIRLDMKNARKK